jgi:hypothetical protein
VSVSELFTQRYRARIESGDLFDEDLYLHRYRDLTEDAADRLWSEEDTKQHHVSEEEALRAQVARAIANANEKHTVKDLPRRARQRMSDAYLQSREPFRGARPVLLTKICESGLDWLFNIEGSVPAEAPFGGSKWSVAANLLLFDYVEVFFDLLPSDDQLDFSRDLNTRLQRGASRWYFQLGRWRRDDWPRDRDDQFDLILYSLNRQADTALERRRNAGAAGGDAVFDAEAFDPEAAGKSLQTAARALWQADRLLTSDLLSDKVRHSAAVRAARMAFDSCLTSFGGVIRGPFVRGKPPRDVKRGPFGRRLSRGPTKSDKSALEGIEEPMAAAIRIQRLGEALVKGAEGLSRDDRLKLLERANLAEFLMRISLFELPSDKSDLEDADADEVRRYSRLTSAPGAGASAAPLGAKRLNHGAGTVHLKLEDKATARLAVDLLARLCQFSTGAASSHGGESDLGSLLSENSHAHPRQLDHQREQLIGRILMGVGLALSAAVLFGAGLLLGSGVSW